MYIVVWIGKWSLSIHDSYFTSHVHFVASWAFVNARSSAAISPDDRVPLPLFKIILSFSSMNSSSTLPFSFVFFPFHVVLWLLKSPQINGVDGIWDRMIWYSSFVADGFAWYMLTTVNLVVGVWIWTAMQLILAASCTSSLIIHVWTYPVNTTYWADSRSISKLSVLTADKKNYWANIIPLLVNIHFI